MPSFLQSISSFFSSPRDEPYHRRDQAMVSVDDAFTVPPDTEYVSGANVYTYPPPSQGGSYDTVPRTSYAHSPYDLRPILSVGSSSGNRGRPPLLPIHHSPVSSRPKYPPLQRTWDRLRAWLDEQYPELADTLNWGIQPPDLAQLEMQLGFTLPPAVRESYLIVDGQEAESSAGCSEGLFFGLTLLPFEDVVDEWRFWREVDNDPATGANPELREHMSSVPPGWIRREYSQRGWLPLVADKAGNYLGIDMDPGERGAVGQVIVFGRDFDTKVVMWRGEGEGGWASWLASFVEELESGEGFELGNVSDGSEDSEDSVGYESYFFDGSAGKGHGGGGGGGSSGGLRLTGEYRGWAVLEALADRSMRRWIDAGVMTQPTTVVQEDAPSKATELAVLDTETESSQTPFGYGDAERDNWKASVMQPNGKPSSSRTHAPSASISKLPAPKPVQLPTEHDLLPSPTTSSPTETSPVYDHDDEEMASLQMREVDRTTPVQATYPLPVKEATLVSLPPSTEALPSKPLSAVTIDTLPPNLQTADNLDSRNFLADTIPEPIVPAPGSALILPHSQPETTLSSAAILTSRGGDASGDREELSVSQVEQEAESQPTVRLVGDITADVSVADNVSASDKKQSLSISSGKQTEVAV